MPGLPYVGELAWSYFIRKLHLYWCSWAHFVRFISFCLAEGEM